MNSVRVMAVIGTRPEALKMGPVVRQLARYPDEFTVSVCASGQHRDLLLPALDLAGLRADWNLDVMQPDQTLAGLTGRLFERIDAVVREQEPDWLFVQGDTTTTMVAATVAFYRRIRIAHVEAGLRTGDLSRPFPEEFNRRIADLCADLCFAPTDRARDHLLREGVPAARVHVTGNTIVDAVLEMAARPYDECAGPLAALPRDRRWVLVTAHRRESFGAPLTGICSAVEQLATRYGSSIHVIVPVHPNPRVRQAFEAMTALPNCSIVAPLDYPDVVQVLKRAALVLTDSGGIQEEAPTFGVPVLVLRDKTERPEGIDAGVAKLVGTEPDTIVTEAVKALAVDRTSTRPVNPYGDGRAAVRIVEILRRTGSPAASAN